MAYDRKLNYYFKRTVEHIHRVQKNMLLVVTEFSERLELSKEDCRELMYNVFKHDRSKFSKEQFEPYIELTEYFHQRKGLGNKDYDYPEGMREKVDAAVDNHYRVENHHPERFINPEGGNLWGYYSKAEAIETVCDLQAMAQEFNEGTCRKFFEKVWKPKHAKHIPDDWNWECTKSWMDQTIKCFEQQATDDKSGGQ